jgi:hypothetical protein
MDIINNKRSMRLRTTYFVCYNRLIKSINNENSYIYKNYFGFIIFIFVIVNMNVDVLKYFEHL